VTDVPLPTSSTGVPVNTIWPPVVAGPRAEVDDPVRMRHHGLVVLADDDRVVFVD
jgi:hypothetical protein